MEWSGVEWSVYFRIRESVMCGDETHAFPPSPRFFALRGSLASARAGLILLTCDFNGISLRLLCHPRCNPFASVFLVFHNRALESAHKRD